MLKNLNNFLNLLQINIIIPRTTSRNFYARSQLAGFESFKTTRAQWQQKFTFARTLDEYEHVATFKPHVLKPRDEKYVLKKLTWLSHDESHLDVCITFCKRHAIKSFISFGDLFAKTCIVMNKMDKLMEAFLDKVGLFFKYFLESKGKEIHGTTLNSRFHDTLSRILWKIKNFF